MGSHIPQAKGFYDAIAMAVLNGDLEAISIPEREHLILSHYIHNHEGNLTGILQHRDA